MVELENKISLSDIYHDNEDIFFEVVPCQLDELYSVKEINESELPEDYPYIFYKTILDSYPEAFLVARLKGDPQKIIGYTMWRVEKGISNFGLKVVQKGHLVSIAVLKDYQGKGVGTALLARSISQVKQYGVQEFVLEVRISNYDAINLYTNTFHFLKQKELKGYYKDGENAHYMALQANIVEE